MLSSVLVSPSRNAVTRDVMGVTASESTTKHTERSFLLTQGLSLHMFTTQTEQWQFFLVCAFDYFKKTGLLFVNLYKTLDARLIA